MKPEATSGHEDSAYNSLKVSEEILLHAVTYCMAPEPLTVTQNLKVPMKSWKAAALHQLLGLGWALWSNVSSAMIYPPESCPCMVKDFLGCP